MIEPEPGQAEGGGRQARWRSALRQSSPLAADLDAKKPIGELRNIGDTIENIYTP